MRTQYITCAAMRSVIVLAIFCCTLFGYEDANVWGFADYDNSSFYTVPAGKFFWLYGMCLDGGNQGNVTLRINNQKFSQMYGISAVAHRFDPPIKFPAGTYFGCDSYQFGSVLIYGYEGTSNQSVEEQNDIGINPAQLNQTQVAPIPFSTYTSISYQVPHQDIVSIRIYDDVGRLIRTIVDDNMSPGNYTARWDGTDSQGRKVAAGSYFCVVKTNGESTTKVVHVK